MMIKQSTSGWWFKLTSLYIIKKLYIS
jgi:hypothetical protein